MMRTLLMMTLGATIGAAAPSTAGASSCPRVTEVQPARGASTPRNTRVWILGNDSPVTYRWLDASGAPVPFSVTRVSLFSPHFLDVLSADALLPAGAAYVVEKCESERSSSCQELTSFATNDVIDNEAPARPEVIGTSVDDSNDTRLVAVSVQGDAIQVMDLDSAGGASPLQPGTKLGDASFAGVLGTGEGPCVTALAEEPVKVRFGTFDLAGNFSGFGAPRELLLRADSEGCAVGSPQGAGWTLLGLLGVGVGRRARRRRAR